MIFIKRLIQNELIRKTSQLISNKMIIFNKLIHIVGHDPMSSPPGSSDMILIKPLIRNKLMQKAKRSNKSVSWKLQISQSTSCESVCALFQAREWEKVKTLR